MCFLYIQITWRVKSNMYLGLPYSTEKFVKIKKGLLNPNNSFFLFTTYAHSLSSALCQISPWLTENLASIPRYKNPKRYFYY